MPALNTGTDFVSNTDALASAVNARFDAIETWANVTKLDSANIQAAAIIESLLADAAVTLTKLADASVNPDKLVSSLADRVGINQTGIVRRGSATVATEEQPPGTTWADLPTPGPSVTIANAPTGFALVVASVHMKADSPIIRVGVHEATDRPLSGSPEINETLLETNFTAYTSNPYLGVMAIPITAGSRTFTLKYARDPGANGTERFKDRKLYVVTFGV